MQNICGECGAQNDDDAEFCAFCRAFLAWDEEPAAARVAGAPAPRARQSLPSERARVDPGPGSDITEVRSLSGAASHDGAPSRTAVGDTTAGLFRVDADRSTVDVAATGEPTLLSLRIANTSTLVDGYAVEVPDSPGWLQVEAGRIQLLPGTEETVPLRLRVVSDALVPMQQIRLVVHVTSLSQAPAQRDLPLTVVVPAVDGPLLVHAEPSMVRVKDRDSADCTLVIDNAASNRPLHLRFTGSDPELAVTFAFDPPELDVPPGASGSVAVTATAAGPEPGQTVSRTLTVVTHDGERTVETHLTLHQTTSQRVEDPPVGLQVQPSLVRVEDGAPAKIRVVADNRAGRNWTHLRFVATDPEGVVNVVWFPSRIDVGPGKAVVVDAILEAPQPKPGSEVTRSVTVKALDGAREATASVTLAQVTSPSPMTTLQLRIEPSIVRVHDTPSAQVQLVVDNQRGRSAAQVHLKGTDPEQAVWFNFSPATVEVAPGQAQAVALRLDSWCPPPGEEAQRQFTIFASDGQSDVKATGTFVQTSSRDAIELLSVRLDPSVLRMAPWRRGTLTARVDNRGGAQPVRVTMSGDDPENVVGFSFAPSVLDIPAGRVAQSRVGVRIHRAPGPEEVTRPFTVTASDGRAEAQVEGELIQGALSLRPFARVFFTVLGGLAMVLGAWGFWRGFSDRGVDLDAGTLAALFGTSLTVPGFAQEISAGHVLIALGVLAIFGLTGGTGRLTRMAALLGALLLVALFAGLAVVGANGTVGAGAYLSFGGCLAAYTGGLLVRR